MSDEWVSHTIELSRKTSETMHDIAFRLEKGEISAETARVALCAMWDCVAGLIERDLMDLLSEAIGELSKKNVQRRLFTRTVEERPPRCDAALLVHTPKTAYLFVGGMTQKHKHHDEDEEAAGEHLNKLVKALNDKGFKELK